MDCRDRRRRAGGMDRGKIMKADHGLLTNIVLGIVGALVLNFILVAVLGVGTLGGWIGQLIIGVIGACLLIWGYRAIRRT